MPPVIADSGRCISLIYAIDLENSAAITHWVKKALHSLAERYSDPFVTVDAKAYDPALPVRLWGTLASQASQVYRPTSILHLPGRVETLAAMGLTGAATSTDQPAVVATQGGVSPETSHLAREDHLNLFRASRCATDDPTAWTPTGMLHEAYVAFCATIGLPPLSAAHFSRELAARFNLQLERRKVRGKVVRGIRGIDLCASNTEPTGDAQ